MPISELIANGIRYPEQTGPSASQRVQSLRSVVQQNEAGELQLTEAKRAAAEDADGRKLFKQAADAGRELSDTEILSAYGPARGAGIIKSRFESKEAREKYRKVKSEHATVQADYVGSQMASVRSSQYDPVVFDTVLSHMDEVNDDPKEVASIRAMVAADPSRIKAIVDQMIGASPAQKKLANDTATADAATLRAKTNQDEFTTRKPGLQAEADTKLLVNATQKLSAAQSQQQWEAGLAGLKAMGASDAFLGQFPAMFSPAAAAQVAQLGMSPDQRADNAATKARDEADKTYKAGQATRDDKRVKLEGQRVGLEGQRVGLEQKKFNATLGAGLDANGQPVMGPDGKPVANPTAQAIANYQIPGPAARSLSTPAGQAIMRQVLALNPEYRADDFPTIAKARQAFTTGPESHKINSLNTAMGHLSMLDQAYEALKGGNYPLLNKLANQLGVNVGKDPVTTFKTIRSLVGPEVIGVYAQGAGGQEERQAMQRNFSESASPEQTAGSIGIVAHAFDSKQGALEQQWKNATGGRVKGFEFLNPEAKEARERLIAKGKGGSAPLPKGGGKTLDATMALKFYKAAGGDPEKAKKLAADNGWKDQ